MRTKPVKVSFLDEAQRAAVSKYAFGQGLEVHEFLLMAAENYMARNKQSAAKAAQGARIYQERLGRASAVQQKPNADVSSYLNEPTKLLKEAEAREKADSHPRNPPPEPTPGARFIAVGTFVDDPEIQARLERLGY